MEVLLRVLSASSFKLSHQATVKVHRAQEVRLPNAFMVGMRNGDRARAKKYRAAPAGEVREVCRKSHDVGLKAVELFHFERRRIADELELAPAPEERLDLAPKLRSAAHRAKKYLGLSFVGHDIGCPAARDYADVDRRRPEQGIPRERHFAQVAQEFEELIDCGLAQMRIGGMGHLAQGPEIDSQNPLCPQGQLVVRRLAINQIIRSSRREVSGARA